MGKYFDDIHASKESQFNNTPCKIEDSPAIKELKAKIRTEPDNYDAYLELGDLLNFQLRYRESIDLYSKAIAINPLDVRGYRSRAPRYIATLQFEKAYKDFAFCEEKSGISLDTSYRIGHCLYFMKAYKAAEIRFISCIGLAENDFEMLAAINYWYIICRIKLGEVNISIPDLMPTHAQISHHAGYQNAVELFEGKLSIAALIENTNRYIEPMNKPIALYGLFNYYIYKGLFEESRQLLESIINDDVYWICFAYIGAWVDCMELNKK